MLNASRKRLARFFATPWVELTVAALIIASVMLTLAEYALEGYGNPQLLNIVVWVNFGLTWVFVVELLLRYAASTSLRRFFKEYWIDILAVIPWFRVFRFGRVVQLLRLIRVLRLFGVVTRLHSHFPYVLKRGLVDYLVVCGLLVVTVIFGTGAIRYFERGATPADGAAFDLESSFWFSVYTLFAGEPVPASPQTVGGKVVAVAVMFMGLTIFAMLTGAVSAFMIERFRMESNAFSAAGLTGHIVICGWNSKSEIIVQEYRASTVTQDVPVVVVAEFDGELPALTAAMKDQVSFINDDFTRIAALETAGVMHAKTCIILSDTSGGRSEQDADARTILAALTVEKLNPDVYTCAELINRSYASHLKMGHVNDYVVSGEYSAYMLAQAAMNRGLMGVITELLTYEHGNEFYRLELNAEWYSYSYVQAMVALKRLYNATLVAVHPEGGDMMVNPVDHVFAEGDEIVVIAEKELKLKLGKNPGVIDA